MARQFFRIVRYRAWDRRGSRDPHNIRRNPRELVFLRPLRDVQSEWENWDGSAKAVELELSKVARACGRQVELWKGMERASARGGYLRRLLTSIHDRM